MCAAARPCTAPLYPSVGAGIPDSLTRLAQLSLPSVGRGAHTPPPITTAPLVKNRVIAKPVRTLAVAIRTPAPCLMHL